MVQTRHITKAKFQSEYRNSQETGASPSRRARATSGDGDWARGRLLGRRLLGVGEVLGVVYDGEEEGARGAARNLLPEAEVVERDLEQVAAGARVRVRLQLRVPLHVLDLHLVVRRHLAAPKTLAPPTALANQREAASSVFRAAAKEAVA